MFTTYPRRIYAPSGYPSWSDRTCLLPYGFKECYLPWSHVRIIAGRTSIRKMIERLGKRPHFRLFGPAVEFRAILGHDSKGIGFTRPIWRSRDAFHALPHGGHRRRPVAESVQYFGRNAVQAQYFDLELQVNSPLADAPQPLQTDKFAIRFHTATKKYGSLSG
jgi:hypothetical protein